MTGATAFDYSGTSILVTGGTSGIGAGIARAFRLAGGSVTLTGTRESPDDYDTDLTGYDYRRCRMTEPSDIDGLVEDLGHLDVLVNNAGANFPGGRSEWTPDAFAESVAVNLLGAFRVAVGCRDLLARSVIPGGGSVIGLASMAAFDAVPLVPGYGAAKAGIVSLTRDLAVEWATVPIRANSVAPGLIETGMTAMMKEIDGLAEPFIDRTPLGRWGTPEDVAPVVLFLASEQARFVTGQTICVDGGYSVT